MTIQLPEVVRISGWLVDEMGQPALRDRMIPPREVLRYREDAKDKCIECGPGVWQIAARLSGLDLDDQEVWGGSIVNTTLALNWHLNPHLRVMAT